jgi:O-antigen/teichoic acid export membrane protein
VTLVRNVLWSWGGYLIYVIAGFLMPRMIDRHLGQTQLGIWDFAWSIVTYLRLAQLGVGSSINRYVSRHRALGDQDGLNAVVSSVTVIQVTGAVFASIATLLIAGFVPFLFEAQLGAAAQSTAWIALLLGLSISIDLACDVFRGMLTGAHRWDLLNAIDAGNYAVSVAMMLVALTLGGGLPALAATYLVGMVMLQIVRGWAAFRACPDTRIRLEYASWDQAKQLLTFGMRSAVPGISRLLLVQANSILVAGALGPAVLAVYARPGALVRHVETFVNKLAFVLVPTASSLQASGKDKDLGRLLIESTRYATGLALPALTFLALTGDAILSVWMGEHYLPGPVLAILAAGYFLPLAQQPAVSILRGLNLHGGIVVAGIVSAVAGIGLGLLLVTVLHLGLTGAALAVAMPLTLGNGLFIGRYACRSVGVRPAEYVWRAFVQPAACVAPFAATLLAIQALVGNRPLATLLLGSIAGGLVLAPLYWLFMVPRSMRAKVEEWLSRARRRATLLFAG